MTITRLDRVSIFGDKLSFLIPHEWVEDTDEAEDVYLYHAPGTDSGWLRLSLITAKNSSAKARDLLAERARQESGNLYQSDRNLIANGKDRRQKVVFPSTNTGGRYYARSGQRSVAKRFFLTPSSLTARAMRRRKTRYPFFLTSSATQSFLIPQAVPLQIE